MITTYHNINFSTQTVPEQIPVVQGDTGREIVFILTDMTIPEGATATYYVQKPSGEAVYNSATISDNTIIVALTAQSIIEVGENDMQVRLILGGEIVTSFRTILMVRPFLGIGAVESSTEINIFDQAVEEAKEEINTTITDAENALADAVEEAIIEVHENALAFYVTDEASGTLATFPDGADLVPVKKMTVDVEAVQSGSGDPSPTNVRPITGWSQAKVTRTGVNVWDGTFTANMILHNADGTTDTRSPSENIFGVTGYIPVKGGESYYAKVLGLQSSQTGLAWYDASKTYISGVAYSNSTASEVGVITAPQNAFYCRMTIKLAENCGLNYPSTDHDYHSGANNETYTIDLSGTRYGGTLDVTSGVLTVTHGFVDLGTLTWADGGTGVFYAQIPTLNTPTNDILCSVYKTVPYSTASTSMPDKSIKSYGNSTQKFIYAHDSAYPSSASDFKTAMDGVQLVYELADPVTVQLDETTVTTLLGQNCIFADCGDVSCEYRADTKLYIDKLLNA